MHPRYGHPLRFYIRPHFRKCRAVVALKLHLVPRTAARPHVFLKQALCKVAFTGGGRTAVVAPRSRVHALRAAVCTPLWCACSVALVRRCAQCVCSVACGQSCCVCPRPPSGLAAARHWPARSARPPPKGAPSAAPQVVHFARDGLGKFVHVRLLGGLWPTQPTNDCPLSGTLNLAVAQKSR